MYRHNEISYFLKSRSSGLLTLCSVVVGHQRFGEPFCLHLQGEVNDAGERGIEIVMQYKRDHDVDRANDKLIFN
jgi:hypothetical protein